MGTVLVQGINFLLTPIFTRLMSVDNYGMLSICTMWATVFSTFITLQIHGSINNALIAYGKLNINQYVSSIQSIGLLNFLVLMTIGLTFSDFFCSILQIPKSIFIALILTSFFQSAIQMLLSKFVAEKKHKQYFLLSFISTILSVVLSVVLVLFQDGSTKYYGKIYGTLYSCIIIGAIVLIYVFIKGKTFIKKEYAVFCLSLTLPLIMHSLSQIVLGQSDRYMLKILTVDANYNVGIYGYAHTIGAVINMLWLAFNYAWVPWYYDKCEQNDKKSIVDMTNKYCGIFTVLTICFILISPEIVKIMAPVEYWTGIYTVPIIALGFFFMFLYSFPVNYEFYKRSTIWISIGTIIAALINIFLNFTLIPKFTVFGAAFATLLSYMALFLFHFFISKYVIKDFQITFITLAKYLLPVLIAVGIYFITINLIWFRWMLCFGIAVSVVIVILKYILLQNDRS